MCHANNMAMILSILSVIIFTHLVNIQNIHQTGYIAKRVMTFLPPEMVNDLI